MSRDDNFLSPLEIGFLTLAAEQYGFVVDRRGIYPTMIKGQNAKQYRNEQDLADFISTMKKV